jgi:hypothetical protein
MLDTCIFLTKCAKELLFLGDIIISSLEEAEIEAITKYPRLTI